MEIPRIPAAEIPRIPAIEIPCEPAAGIPAIPAAGIPWEAAAEIPREMSPLCFAEGASAKPDSLDVTWPEMYDYLFCDSQEEEEELGGWVEGWNSPLQREFSWPELYEHFFNEPEGSRKKGKAKDRRRKKFSSLDHAGLQKEDPSPAPGEDTVVIPVPDVYGHFFPERAQSRMGWRGIFSMAPASEVKKAVGALKSLLQRQMQLGGGQASTSQALVPRGSGEKLALVPLGGAQVWPGDADTALALRGKSRCPLQGHVPGCVTLAGPWDAPSVPSGSPLGRSLPLSLCPASAAGQVPQHCRHEQVIWDCKTHSDEKNTLQRPQRSPGHCLFLEAGERNGNKGFPWRF